MLDGANLVGNIETIGIKLADIVEETVIEIDLVKMLKDEKED